MSNIHAVVQHKIDQLHYDFNHFTVDSFLTWLQQRDQTSFELYQIPLPARRPGAWIPDRKKNKHYFFIRQQSPPPLKPIIAMHEVGHYLFKHDLSAKNKNTNNNFYTVLRRGGEDIGIDATVETILLHANKEDDEQEVIAETFAMLMQKKIAAHVEMDMLTISRNIEHAKYLKSLGFL